jgi:hypothetical protein
MTSAERGEVLVTARLLEAAGKVDVLSTGITLIAAASLFFASPHRAAALAAIVLGIVAKLYAVRIAFDARLLADVAAGTLTTLDLDAAFPAKSGRSWALRCRGARRLVVVFGVVAVLQCAVVACALVF